MQAFRCATCDHLVFFDNSACLRCGSELGYDADERELLTVEPADEPTSEPVPDAADVGGSVAPRTGPLVPVGGGTVRYRRCANREVASCNWLIPADDPVELCASCRLTSVRPADDDPVGLAAYADAEFAKRRLLQQLAALSLPIVARSDDEPEGLTFELLSSRGRTVTTGHEAGTITLDLSESDDAHREFVRQQLGEPYRTVLGHLRHEIGHYYWPMLVRDRGLIDEFRELFGDERISYQESLEQHYADGPPDLGAEWVDTHVSQYATMHPWEDWAETFAHYLHIQAGVETAAEFGLQVGDPSASAGAESWSAPHEVDLAPMIDRWLGLTFALNGIARSIGQADLYPFVLSPLVVSKLEFVHRAASAVAG